MKYLSSQSYHTLNHWQSGKRKKETGPYTSYLDGCTNFQIQGLYDDSGPILFPWTLHEADSVAGDTWYGQTRSRYPFTAWYISPETETVFAEKWTTADGYDVYYRVDKAGENVHTIPGQVPWSGDAVTLSYAKCTHEDGNILIPTYEAYPNAGTSGWRVQYAGSITIDGSYQGRVALPVINRYEVHWTYYTAGTTSVAQWCGTCTDMGSTTEKLSTASKWSNGCIIALSQLCAKLHPYEWFHEVPRLKGVNPLVWSQSAQTYYRWPVLRGGMNGNDSGGAPFYVAGATSETEATSETTMPYVLTGMDPATSTLDYGVYRGVASNVAASVVQAVSAQSCVMAGDMGIPYKNGTEGYCPINTDYKNGWAPYMYAGTSENGITTVVRRIHDIEIQDGFQFFKT